MQIRLIVDDILKASTTLTNAQIGKLLVSVCKSQLKLSRVEYIPKEDEVFLWKSFEKSRLIAERVSNHSILQNKIRWEKVKKKENNNENN